MIRIDKKQSIERVVCCGSFGYPVRPAINRVQDGSFVSDDPTVNSIDELHIK